VAARGARAAAKLAGWSTSQRIAHYVRAVDDCISAGPSGERLLLIEVIKRTSDPAKQKQIFRAMLMDDNKLLGRCLDACFDDWSRRDTNGNAASDRNEDGHSAITIGTSRR
jgi:hypothetical protein